MSSEIARALVAAAVSERRRMERDLHDGAQEQLVLLGLKLSTHVEGGCAGTPNHGDCVQGVSCPSTALCVAVDLFGGVLLGKPAPRDAVRVAQSRRIRSRLWTKT